MKPPFERQSPDERPIRRDSCPREKRTVAYVGGDAREQPRRSGDRSKSARGTSWGSLAQGRGALSLVPGPFKPPGRNFASGENDGAQFSRHRSIL